MSPWDEDLDEPEVEEYQAVQVQWPKIVERSSTRWMERARCKKAELQVFFRTDDKWDAPSIVIYNDAAIKVCEQCPVKAACLSFALENPDEFGVWGGTTHYERKEIRSTTKVFDEAKLLAASWKRITESTFQALVELEKAGFDEVVAAERMGWSQKRMYLRLYENRKRTGLTNEEMIMSARLQGEIE